MLVFSCEMKKLYLAVFLCNFIQTYCENLKVLSKIHSSFLDKYSSYADVVILNFNVPPDLKFVSFKFEAEEVNLSFFKCQPQEVSIYLKEGSPAVINPDGSKLPERLLNVSRPDFHVLELKSDKTVHYVNMTSPIPGNYFAIAFISWTDPTNDAITQQGLTAECMTYVDAVLYSANATAVDVIIPNQNIQVTINATRIFKFYVPEFVDHAMLTVNSVLLGERDSLGVRIDARRLPSVNNSLVDFTLNYTEDYHPHSAKFWTEEENWHYVEMTASDVSVNFRLQFYTVTDLVSFRKIPPLRNLTRFFKTAVQKVHRTDRLTEMIPYKQYNLVKLSSTESFLYSFDLQSEIETSVPISINLTASDFSVLKFVVEKGSDVGGSLQFSLAFSSKVKTYSERHVIVGCIRRNAREVPTWPDRCNFDGTQTKAPIILNRTAENGTVYIPYPEPGTWFATFRLFNGSCEKCSNCSEGCNSKYLSCMEVCEAHCASRRECEYCPLNCKEEVLVKKECKSCDCDGECRVAPKPANASVLFDISSYPCLAGRCGANGRCVYMVSGGFAYSTCVCSNNYRGWDCMDDSLANSYGAILAELLLLVLSNVAFVPATYVAFRRKYFVESIVYACLCFFSTFYHACDAGENIVSFCITKVAVLQFADFFTALLAIWVTLIAMADLPSFYPSLFHMIGAIFLSFGTTADRRSLWVFAVPAACGIAIILLRWLWYYRKNRFLPISKRYLCVNLPSGLLFVSVGLVVYAALQTNSNYKYTHSFWHVVMAVAVVILLPKRDTFSVRSLM